MSWRYADGALETSGQKNKKVRAATVMYYDICVLILLYMCALVLVYEGE